MNVAELPASTFVSVMNDLIKACLSVQVIYYYYAPLTVEEKSFRVQIFELNKQDNHNLYAQLYITLL